MADRCSLLSILATGLAVVCAAVALSLHVKALQSIEWVLGSGELRYTVIFFTLTASAALKVGLWKYCLKIKSAVYNVDGCYDLPDEGDVKEMPFVPVDKIQLAQKAGVASIGPLGLCLFLLLPLACIYNPKAIRGVLFLMALSAAAGGAAALTAVAYFTKYIKEGNYTIPLSGIPLVAQLTYGENHLLLITVSAQCAVSTVLLLAAICLLPPMQDPQKSTSPEDETAASSAESEQGQDKQDEGGSDTKSTLSHKVDPEEEGKDENDDDDDDDDVKAQSA